MRKLPATIAAALLALATPGHAETPAAPLASADVAQQVSSTPWGDIITPGSSQPRPARAGRVAHTNVHLFRPSRLHTADAGASNPGETPASLACLYGVAPHVAGCNPQTLTTVATGGSRVIALVDAYDYPTAGADLAAFSARFGLPPVTSANFSVVYAGGTQPSSDPTGGWELEAALDIEMAHALAPGARIILVEAASEGYTDLFAAEQVASALVSAGGGGEVSNSWSGAEFNGEDLYGAAFTGKYVTFFASAGDQPGVGLPSAFPNVVSVGGTTINRDGAGNFVSQTAWSSTGGGLSAFLATPAYQQPVASMLGGKRGTPDVSLVANPYSGVWIYDTTPYNGDALGWLVVGGTSVSSPGMAALVNNAGAFRYATVGELRLMYANMARPKMWTDVTAGGCGNTPGGTATVGYDLCTGIGTPLGRIGK